MVKKINQSQQSRPVCTPRIFWLLGEALGAPLANSRPLLKTLKQLLSQSCWRNVVSLGGGSCKDGKSQKRQENFHSLSGPLSFQEISKTPSNLSGKLLWKEAVTTHPSLSLCPEDTWDSSHLLTPALLCLGQGICFWKEATPHKTSVLPDFAITAAMSPAG